ncbi:MAG: hypothetical protein ACI9S8_002963, partial [Chlamydiales bacterium]
MKLDLLLFLPKMQQKTLGIQMQQKTLGIQMQQ